MKSLWQFITSPTNSRTLGLLILLILVAAIPLTVYVAQQQQTFRQFAGDDEEKEECDTKTGRPGGCECKENIQCASLNCEKPEGKKDGVCTLGPTPTSTPSGTPTPTIPPNATPTPTLPPGVTATPTPTPLPPPPPGTGSGQLKFDLTLEGVSNNPEAGNTNPKNPSRTLVVEFLTLSGQKVAEISQAGAITFNASLGTFAGSVAMPNLTQAVYNVKVKTDKYLRKLFSNYTLSSDSTVELPRVTLIVGDANNDNLVDVVDYNLVTNVCFGTKALLDPSCSRADLDDDGDVDIFDANLVIRSMAKREGD